MFMKKCVVGCINEMEYSNMNWHAKQQKVKTIVIIICSYLTQLVDDTDIFIKSIT